MQGTVVGVLRGGPSRQHEASLATGAVMLSKLPEERFQTRDIYIDKSGAWHDRGRPTTPDRALRQLDVVLIALHGEYGEDGEVQKILQRAGVPYSGSEAFNAHVALHKLMAKARAQEAGLLTPSSRYLDDARAIEGNVHEIIRAFSQPVVVKPVGWGPVGASVVGGYAHVLSAIEKLFAEGAPAVLVEEYIRGPRASVAVVEGLRGEALYVLPSVESTLVGEEERLVCPGNFSRVAREELTRAAKLLHRSLDLRHYSESDFVVAPSGVYYLETSPLPRLGAGSPMALALSSVGVPLPDFLGHLVNLALER